jgi:cyd operon protein YbgE
MSEENLNTPNTWNYSFPARLFSLLLAIGLTVLVLAYPKAFAPEGIHSVRHDLLSLMMLGIAAGFVHGVGFVPQQIGWRILLGPYLGWLLMLSGLMWIGALLF